MNEWPVVLLIAIVPSLAVETRILW